MLPLGMDKPEKGAAFREMRERAKLPQAEVAIALGVRQAAVSKWETGRALPAAGKLVKLAVLLGCSVEDLVVGVDHSYDQLRKKQRDLIDHGIAPRSPFAQRGTVDVTAPAAPPRVLSDVHPEIIKSLTDVSRLIGRALARAQGESLHRKSAATGKTQPRPHDPRGGNR